MHIIGAKTQTNYELVLKQTHETAHMRNDVHFFLAGIFVVRIGIGLSKGQQKQGRQDPALDPGEQYFIFQYFFFFLSRKCGRERLGWGRRGLRLVRSPKMIPGCKYEVKSD